MRDTLEMPLVQRLFSQIRHSVPIKNIRTPFGESFDLENHWVKTLAEYKVGITDFKKSSLYAFHRNFQPKTILDAVSSVDDGLAKVPELGSYPWGKWTSRVGSSQWERSTHCGPSSDELIEKEWESFIALFEKIKVEGFDYKKYGHPLGIFFIDKLHQKFFIVLGGNHRTAIASSLGLESMRVRLLPRKYLTSQTVRYRDISHDPLSKKVFSGIISSKFVNWKDGKCE